MRKLSAHIICMLLFLFAAEVNAQDIHFSQVHATPLFNNPALTGLINGDVRAAAIYRNFSLGQGSGYQTISASADAKLFNISGDDDWLSGGLMLFQDKAGTLGLTTNSFDLSLAYNAGLGGSGHFVSAGIQVGAQQRRLDLSNAEFGNQFDGTDFDAGMASNEALMNTQSWSPKVAAGLMYYYLASPRKYVFAGASAFHLNAATNSFTGVQEEADRMKVHFIAGGSFPVSDNIDIVPSLYSAWQEVYSQVNLGTSVRYVMPGARGNSYSAITLGPFVRISDIMNNPAPEALIIMGRAEVSNLTFGMSYDVVINDLQNGAGGTGAIELSVVYEFNSGRTPSRGKRGGSTSCPRF